LVYWSGHLRALRSFPTRRSSDLVRDAAVVADAQTAEPVQENALVDRHVAADAHALRKPDRDPVLDLPAFDPCDEQLQHQVAQAVDRKSTRLNSSHVKISYAVFCL